MRLPDCSQFTGNLPWNGDTWDALRIQVDWALLFLFDCILSIRISLVFSQFGFQLFNCRLPLYSSGTAWVMSEGSGLHRIQSPVSCR